MNELDKIKYMTRMQDKWLKEHDRLKRTIKILKFNEVVVAFKTEGMSVFGNPIKYHEEYLTKSSRLKLLDILIEELREFEEKGFDKWLEEQESKNEEE